MMGLTSERCVESCDGSGYLSESREWVHADYDELVDRDDEQDLLDVVFLNEPGLHPSI